MPVQQSTLFSLDLIKESETKNGRARSLNNHVLYSDEIAKKLRRQSPSVYPASEAAMTSEEKEKGREHGGNPPETKPTTSASERKSRLKKLVRGDATSLPPFRITKRDVEIIKAVYAYRALTTDQVEALF